MGIFVIRHCIHTYVPPAPHGCPAIGNVSARASKCVCARAAPRAKFSKKVHKPPFRVNVINFELNGFNASIWVPWSPSDPKKF